MRVWRRSEGVEECNEGVRVEECNGGVRVWRSVMEE